VSLSGGPLLGLLLGLGVMSALRGRAFLVVALALAFVGVLLAPGMLRPNHGRALVASVQPAIENNFLLDNRALLRRAEQLVDGGNDRYGDARRLLTFIHENGEVDLTGPQLQRYTELTALCKSKTQQGPVWEHPDFGSPRLARRYVGWQAAIAAVRHALAHGGRLALFGRGAGGYEREVIKQEKWFAGIPKLHYNTDEPEVFNLGCDEADTFSQFLVTATEMGLVGLAALVWVWLSALGKAGNVWATSRDSFHRGLALGLLGALIAFPVCAIFSGILVRGLAVPFVFIIVCANLLRRFETEVHPG